MSDSISRQDAIKALADYEELANRNKEDSYDEGYRDGMYDAVSIIEELPSAESLTDAEQRIFLAAMEREEKVCEEIDGNLVREAYEDSLFSICREIKRKVKSALWT